MARVTVEDCVKNIPNRFELVLAAANRAKKLSKGATPHVPRGNEKNPVLALREIAQDKGLATDFGEDLITSLQRINPEMINDDTQEVSIEMEKDWSEQIAQLSKELESLGSLGEDDNSATEDDLPSEDIGDTTANTNDPDPSL